MSGIFLDFDTADRITVLNLQDARKSIKADLDNHYEGTCELQPEDVRIYREVYEAMGLLLSKWYGADNV